ncbi:MAG: virulence RhuM family protein [Bacilli bacterium]
MDNKIIRSSAVEYLTYISSGGESGIEAIYENENIWLSQKMIALLYDVTIPTINEHLKKIFKDKELEENSVIRNFRITANDKKNYDTKHYNLECVIALGYKVNSEKAVSFRKWANSVIKEFTIKGFAMDDERLKNSGSILTKKYFEEQLARIREIRLSERKFYQKITDIFSTSIDYDKNSKTTLDFFKKIQNKLHFATTNNTAAEIIYNRACSTKTNMGLATWKDSPNGKIIETDVVIAKNYLTKEELKSLGLIVSAYLDLAEDRANRHIPTTMEDWVKTLDDLLKLTDREILLDGGKISHDIAEKHALSEFEKYRIIQDKKFISDYDLFTLENKEE